MDVKHLRKWIDDPRPMGLPQDAQNLIILLFAAQCDYTVYRHGGPDEPTLQSLHDDCELRAVPLPNPELWDRALKRAGMVFGVVGNRRPSAGNLGTFSADLKKKADEVRRACQTFCQKLRDRMICMGVIPEGADRMMTAAATQAIVTLVASAEPANVISAVAGAAIATSEAAMLECLGKAAELEGNLETAGWEVFEAIGRLADERRPAAEEILAEVRQALASDEHVTALAPALKGAHARAVRLLTKAPPTPRPPVVPPSVPPPSPMPPVVRPVPKGKKVVGQDTKQDLSMTEAHRVLSEVEGKIQPGQTARINVSWVIEEGDTP
jgi:hypothetical protein